MAKFRIVNDPSELQEGAQYNLVIMLYSQSCNVADGVQDQLKLLALKALLLLLWKSRSMISEQCNIFDNLMEKNSDFLKESKLPEILDSLGFCQLTSIANSLLCGDVYHRSPDIATAANVIHAFIELTERIANGRTNVLRFEEP